LLIEKIESKIYTIRGAQVMLDSDLANLYSVETKKLNQAVKRNSDRFPDSFCFRLTMNELKEIKSEKLRIKNIAGNSRSQIVTLKMERGQNTKYLPLVFTEQGVAMLSAVLRSKVAVKVSIQIIQTFVAMRKTLTNLHGIFQRLETIELKQLKTDNTLEKVLKALEHNDSPQQGIFFEGQLFDAHLFISKLIKQAKKSLILVDNYVDENTLLLLSKRKKQVKCTIYSKPKASFLKDLEKHNLQYAPVYFIQNHSSHDRFLLIDDNQLYHIGASLKDLGLKCFAFNRMDSLTNDLKGKLLE